MSTNEVQQIEMNIKDAQELVELGKSLQRLRTNPDFKKLVLEGYLKSECVRLVHLKGDANMQGERAQASIDRDITAIGAFLQYLRTTETKADMALDAITEGEQTLDDLRTEGADE